MSEWFPEGYPYTSGGDSRGDSGSDKSTDRGKDQKKYNDIVREQSTKKSLDRKKGEFNQEINRFKSRRERLADERKGTPYKNGIQQELSSLLGMSTGNPDNYQVNGISQKDFEKRMKSYNSRATKYNQKVTEFNLGIDNLNREIANFNGKADKHNKRVSNKSNSVPEITRSVPSISDSPQQSYYEALQAQRNQEAAYGQWQIEYEQQIGYEGY